MFCFAALLIMKSLWSSLEFPFCSSQADLGECLCSVLIPSASVVARQQAWLHLAPQVAPLGLSVPGLTQRIAANRLRTNGAPVSRARRRAQRVRCCYRVVWSRTLLRGGSTYARPYRGCTMRPLRRQQRTNVSRCVVAISGIAQVLALFLSREGTCPVGCPPFSPASGVARAPAPAQLQEPW